MARVDTGIHRCQRCGFPFDEEPHVCRTNRNREISRATLHILQAIQERIIEDCRNEVFNGAPIVEFDSFGQDIWHDLCQLVAKYENVRRSYRRR